MGSAWDSEIKQARVMFSFGKRVTRQSRNERGISLCVYCGVENGNENEHILPVAWAHNYPEQAAMIIRELMGFDVELVEYMKSANNHAPCCSRCNFDKRRKEDNCFSFESRLALVMEWQGKAKKWNKREKRWITRSMGIETGRRRQHSARSIQYLKGKNPKLRAKLRRKARGRKEYRDKVITTFQSP